MERKKKDSEFLGFNTCCSRTRADSRSRLVKKLVHQVENHSNKVALMVGLQSNRPYDPLIEESKPMVHKKGNVFRAV